MFKVNNGSVLVDGRLTPTWGLILFWRSFIAMVLHYIAILIIGSMSLKLGIVTNHEVDTKNEELDDMPRLENVATNFSFVKQQFYHKSLAYTNYQKNK